jgi:hypothetical protein
MVSSRALMAVLNSSKKASLAATLFIKLALATCSAFGAHAPTCPSRLRILSIIFCGPNAQPTRTPVAAYALDKPSSGFTWTHPSDDESGLLFKGGFYHDAPSYHCAPVPVLEHNGRIYKAFEDCDPCEWGVGFQACVISAPVDADLLDAKNWTMTNKIPFDPSWIPSDWEGATIPGWREGNVVADPDGQLWDIMTFEAGTYIEEKSPRLKILDNGKTLAFDPENGFFDFPGSKAKFTIRRDPETGKYLSLVNNLASKELLIEMTESITSQKYRGKHPYRQRNVVSLTTSDDLWNWRIVKTVMQDDTGLTPDASILLTGFQYVDWQFDGDDLIYMVRTGYRGAGNFHDSNRMIFRVLKNFRDLLT